MSLSEIIVLRMVLAHFRGRRTLCVKRSGKGRELKSSSPSAIVMSLELVRPVELDQDRRAREKQRCVWVFVEEATSRISELTDLRKPVVLMAGNGSGDMNCKDSSVRAHMRVHVGRFAVHSPARVVTKAQAGEVGVVSFAEGGAGPMRLVAGRSTSFGDAPSGYLRERRRYIFVSQGRGSQRIGSWSRWCVWGGRSWMSLLLRCFAPSKVGQQSWSGVEGYWSWSCVCSCGYASRQKMTPGNAVARREHGA